MKTKHYLIIQNEKPVGCCNDDDKQAELDEYPGSSLYELDETEEECPICGDEEL